MLKKVKNKRIIVIDSVDSPYFERGVLILKDAAVYEDDKIMNEANKIITHYAKKYEPKYKKGPNFSPFLAFGAAIISIIALLNTVFV